MWRLNNFNPEDIKTEDDLAAVPMIMVNLFKENEWITGSKDNIVLTLGSSGTTGQRSLMHLDQGSLDRVKQLARSVHSALGITSNKKYNYLCFTYDPDIAKDVGTAFTDRLITSFTDVNEVYYAIEWCDRSQEFRLNEEKIVKLLHQFAEDKHPTRIVGFPAFLYKVLKEHKIKITLPEDSWTQTGGGWKNHGQDNINKTEFKKFVNSCLGIPTVNQRDLFGMVEHGIPYIDDENGHLAIPAISRIYIRDPKTLEIKENGEPGLIQFMCSYNSSYPSLNLLSTDWGRVYDVPGKNYQSLEILGRAGISKHKGCALTANEILRKSAK